MATEGNTTDFKFIEAEILALASRFVVTELAYDRTFAGEIVRNLQDEGLSLVEFGQGFLSMGPASAEFLRLLIGRELQHGGNPIVTWCASNVSVRKDPAGNEKPDKERSTEKIDAIVAAVMAVGRMQAGGQGARSVYESIAAAAAFRKEFRQYDRRSISPWHRRRLGPIRQQLGPIRRLTCASRPRQRCSTRGSSPASR